MTEISATAQIDASPQHVWAILADLASYPQWNPLFREASGQLTAGTTVTFKSVRPGTERVMTVKVKMLAAEPGAQLRWISSLPGSSPVSTASPGVYQKGLASTRPAHSPPKTALA